MLVLTACASGTGAGSLTEPSNTTSAAGVTTTTTTATTLTTTTTTTTLRTTTTTSVIDASPAEEDRDAYGLLALLTLNSTVFSPEQIGNDAFAEMIVFGAQLACLKHAEQGTMAEVIEESVGRSPVASIPVDEWTPEQTTAAFSTVLHIISQGMPLYCPSLPLLLDIDSANAADAFSEAWHEFISE